MSRRFASALWGPAPVVCPAALTMPALRVALQCSDWRTRLGGHSITDLLLALSERGLVRVKFRGHPHGSMNAFYSRASGPIPQPAAKSAHARADERPPAPVPAASADRSRLAADVPPGSRREALLVQAVENSCPAGQERQGGDLGIALGRLDRWADGGALLLTRFERGFLDRTALPACCMLLFVRGLLVALPA